MRRITEDDNERGDAAHRDHAELKCGGDLVLFVSPGCYNE